MQCNEQTESLNHFEWTGSSFTYTCCCENNCCHRSFGAGRDTATRPYWPAGLANPIHEPEPQRPDDGAWTNNPPDAPGYSPTDAREGGYARPPPDDPAWMRGALGTSAHHVYGVWKGDPMAQLASVSSHLDGKAGKE